MPATFTQSATVTELLQSLEIWQRRDKATEATMSACRKQEGWWGLGLGGGIVLAIFTGIAKVPVAPIIFLLVALATLPGVIYWEIQYRKAAKEDIEDRRLLLSYRLLAILGRDIPRKRKCTLSLNFQGYQQHGVLAENTRSGFFGALRQKKYLDNWFLAKGTLCDGSIFRVKITQVVRRKEKAKRKYTKVTEHIAEEVTLALRIDPTAYPEWYKLERLLQQAQLQGLTLARVLVKDGTVRVTAKTADCVRVSGRYSSNTGEENLANGDMVLQLFLYVYAQLQHCLPQKIANG